MFHGLGACEVQWRRRSGPAAFRKHAPGLTGRGLSARHGKLSESMHQLPGSEKATVGYLRPGKRGVNVSPRASSTRASTCRDVTLFALLFGVISLLYATVGQAGGTAFLALMASPPFRRPRCARRRLRSTSSLPLTPPGSSIAKKSSTGESYGRFCFRRYRRRSSVDSSCWTSKSTSARPASCCFSPAPR